MVNNLADDSKQLQATKKVEVQAFFSILPVKEKISLKYDNHNY